MSKKSDLLIENVRLRALVRAAVLHLTGHRDVLLHLMRERFVEEACDALGVADVDEILASRRVIPAQYKCTERIDGGSETRSFTQRWACDPPPLGVPYRVLREGWDDDYEVRTIYQIAVSDTGPDAQEVRFP